MPKIPETYEEECALQSLIPFNGDSGASQRTSVAALIYRQKLFVRCGLCALRHELTVDALSQLDLPPCMSSSTEL